MSKTLKGKIEIQQTLRASCLVTTTKQMIAVLTNKLRTPVFPLKQTQGASLNNRNTLAASNQDLGNAQKSRKVIPLDHGSELRDPTGIAKLFGHHEDKGKNGHNSNISQYHLSPIEEATRKPDLYVMILKTNHKSSKLKLNSAALEKATGKEVQHGWVISLTIDLVCHIKNAGVVPLGVAEKLSVNEKGQSYKNMCTTHD